MKTYNFKEQLLKGQVAENALDLFFMSKGVVEIQEVTKEQQKKGIDRIFIFENGQKLHIEYKADEKTSVTGNAFIETISNNKSGSLGWALKCCADYVVYYVLGYKQAAIIKPSKLVEKIPEWTFKYKARPCKNPTYFSFGLIVPWGEITEISERIVDIDIQDFSSNKDSI